jgi:ABC-2 type transport system ATP-binding protein
MKSIIEVKNFGKTYNGATVLEGINFDIQQGETIGVVGLNGAGKTTLLESIEGLRKIQTGSISVMGKSLASEFKSIQQDIGIQLQRTSLIGDITVKETLRLFKALYKVKTDVNELLAKVDLVSMANKKVKHLSGGQYQRFNLCLSVLNTPKIVFLDEPTTGLDPIARRQLWSIVNDLKKQNVTILITTHYLDEVQQLCDKILIISNHKVVAYDTPDNLIKTLNDEKTIIVEGIEELSETEKNQLEEKFKCKYLDNQFLIYTHDLGGGLNVFFEWLNANGKRVSNISVRTANLEDVFIQYTSSKIETNNITE